nr:hypothetical protein [uncultured Desulfobacter sp.]
MKILLSLSLYALQAKGVFSSWKKVFCMKTALKNMHPNQSINNARIFLIAKIQALQAAALDSLEKAWEMGHEL